METNFHGLPPFKRYKLLQQRESNNSLNNKNPVVPTQTPPICLPAKKRKQTSPPFCLPAKKRIWAPHPFDLNLEYEQDNNNNVKQTQEQQQQQQKQQQQQNIDDDGEDGIVCAVCDSTDGDPTDPIVLCDGCDLMVHSTCYGHPFTKGIPQGDWYCDRCLASKNTNPTAEISCCLCPVSGGALKATVDGKWAHLVCAIYVPEVFFIDPEGRRGIDCSKVLKRRWEKECCVCEAKKNSRGCVIDCSEPKCELGFHVTCGLKQGFCIEYRQGKRNKGDVVAAFCSAHTDLWNKQEQTGKFKIVARDEHKN